MTQSSLVIVYSGTEITVNLLKEELEKSGVASYIRNDFNSGVIAGFSGGAPSAADLYIEEEDMDKAQPIVQQFTGINQ